MDDGNPWMTAPYICHIASSSLCPHIILLAFVIVVMKPLLYYPFIIVPFYFCVAVSWCQCLADMELMDFSDLQKLSLISDMSFTFLNLLYESKKFEKKRLQRIPFLVKSNYNFAPRFPLQTSMGHWSSNQNVVPTKF